MFCSVVKNILGLISVNNHSRYNSIFIFFLLSIVSLSTAQQSVDLSYLKEMPDTTRVINDIKGSDKIDTAARQWGAFYQLRDMLDVMSEGRVFRNQLTKEEVQIRKNYQQAMVQPKFDPEEYKRLGKNWGKLSIDYELDASLRNELLKLYFSPEWQTHYLDLLKMNKEKRQQFNNEQLQQQQQRQQQLAQQEKQQQQQLQRHAEQWWRQNHNGSDTEFQKKVVINTAIFFALFFVLWIVAVIFSFGGRFELDPTNPRKLYLGGTFYTLYSDTGTVVSPSKDREVRTHVHGGQVSGGYNSPVTSTPVTSTTTTITHLEFFLQKANGEERPIHVTSGLADTAVREGHKLSAVWMIRKGKESGNYFMFRNHSTGQTIYNDASLKGMVTPWWKTLVIITSFLSCIGVLLLIPYLIVLHMVLKNRVHRVEQQMNNKLIPLLDSQV